MKRMIAIGMMAMAAGVIGYAACAAIDTAIAVHEWTTRSTRSVTWGQCWSGPIWADHPGTSEADAVAAAADVIMRIEGKTPDLQEATLEDN